MPELSRSGGKTFIPQIQLPQRQVPEFDGEKAFERIIQPYSNYSEYDLEHELFERSPYRITGENEFAMVLESLYAPDDMLFVELPLPMLPNSSGLRQRLLYLDPGVKK